MSTLRDYQKAVAERLNQGSVLPATVYVEDQPGTIAQAQTGLKQSGWFIVVSYPTTAAVASGVLPVTVSVMVHENPEVNSSESDVLDVAEGIFTMLYNWTPGNGGQDQPFSAVRVTGMEPIGPEDGIMVYRILAETRTQIDMT